MFLLESELDRENLKFSNILQVELFRTNWKVESFEII